MANYWYIGAILSMIGSIASNLGVNVQKYSFMQTERLPEAQRKPYYKQGCVINRGQSQRCPYCFPCTEAGFWA